MVPRFSSGRKNSTFSSSRSRSAKKASSCCLAAGGERRGMSKGNFAAALQLEPFVADDHHRLRQIKRGESRIDRQRDDGVGERHLVVFQPVALAAEDDGHVFASGDARRRFRRRRVGADHGLGLVVIARGRRQHEACNRRSRLASVS